MMKAKEGRYGVYTSKNLTLIKLPYQGNASMVIILPNEDKLEEVEKQLTHEQLREWVYKARQR